MIPEFVKLWDTRKEEVRALFAAKHPEDYTEVVRNVIGIMKLDGYAESPSVERIHKIDDGEYQGTLVFVIGDEGYQPSNYWYVKVNYGSCSGCDTLQSIQDYSDGPPSEDQVSQYMTLALHIVQGLKKMGDED